MARIRLLPGLNQNLAHMSKRAVPPELLHDRFCASARAISERVHACACECYALAALRDTLLPILTSDELKVRDIEHRVGAAP